MDSFHLSSDLPAEIHREICAYACHFRRILYLLRDENWELQPVSKTLPAVLHVSCKARHVAQRYYMMRTLHPGVYFNPTASRERTAPQ